MAPIVKDPENVAAPTAPGIPTGPVSNAAARPQPVALEVPVTVNGSRLVEGSEKREPFSERSQTVLVFGHGAVLRISALLGPGQLVFLTNEKTKKEVVCVVVKSKTDGNAVGYVELRFTEPAPGFWGMRFSFGHGSAASRDASRRACVRSAHSGAYCSAGGCEACSSATCRSVLSQSRQRRRHRQLPLLICSPHPQPMLRFRALRLRHSSPQRTRSQLSCPHLQRIQRRRINRRMISSSRLLGCRSSSAHCYSPRPRSQSQQHRWQQSKTPARSRCLASP